MAHKKAAGSAKNLRDSNAKYRGLKLSWWQDARAGNIIVRQKGSKYECGQNTYMGKDHTIHAAIDGIVVFWKKNYVRFDWRKYLKTFVSVLSYEDIALQAKDQAVKSAPETKKKAPKKSVAKKSMAKKVEKQVEAIKEDVADWGTDDLTKIEGIGPKIQEVFYAAWIKTYADLSSSKVWDLRSILADNKLSQHEPKTWKKQATLAKNGKWDALEELQKELMWWR